MTNWRLGIRAGSELYLLDVARWLRDKGHVPVAYAPTLGAVADELRAEGIAVVDNLRLLAEPPEVIHGQHHLSTMTAIATFPEVPVVALCHGWLPWEELPIPHPAIRRYVAVSRHTRERVVLESGIDPTLVRVLPNFVDVERFQPRASLPARPRRALIFSNYAVSGRGWVDAVAAACASLGLPLDVVGGGWGNSTDRPEQVLLEADLVFAKARAAMEAMATGAGVILCDEAGIGPFVTPANFDELRDGNFGMAVLRTPHDVGLVATAIERYDSEAATAVTERVRNELGRDAIVPRLLRFYEEAIEDAQRKPVDEQLAAEAMANYLYQLNRLDPVPKQEIARAEALARERLELDRARNREIAALRAELQPTMEVPQQIAALRAELETMREVPQQIAELGRERESLISTQREVAALRAELETMRMSTSWQVTAPLRRAGASARKVASRWRK